MIDDGGDVLQLGQPGPALDRVAPRGAVPRRAPVVDLDDREPGVDPGRPHGAEPVLVGGVRAAVQAEHRRQRADRVRRAGHQRVHPPPGAGHPQVPHRHGGRRGRAGWGQQHAVGAVIVQRPHGRRLSRRRARVLDGAIRAHFGRPDRSRGDGELGQLAAAQVVPVQPGAGGVDVRDQQRVPVGVEVGDQLAGQVDREFGLGVGEHVPDQQLLAPAPLVLQQQPGVAGHRREGQRGQPLARAVGLVGDRGDGPVGGEPHHAHRRVARVAVLGVPDREQRLVLRQRPDVRVLRMRVHDLGPAAVARDPDPAAVVGRRPDGDDRPADLQPGGVPVVNAGDRRLWRRVFGSAGERLRDPVPELVAVGVGEPPHRRAVRREGGRVRAAASVGDAAVGVGRPVPHVDLGGAARVRRIDAALRRIPRPPRSRHPRGGEPRPPPSLPLVVGEEPVGDGRGRVGGVSHAPDPAVTPVATDELNHA